MFKKESLEKLRERIDLVEVISRHVDMKRAGSAYKSLCPFHHEKTPSFMIQKGDTHYHCFGCGAHGDAIQFLMNYLNLTFIEAVEQLADRFNVILERENVKQAGVDRGALKEILAFASHFFHASLLYTEEGREALFYLYRRGITIDFIKRFEVGFATAQEPLFWKIMQEAGMDESLLLEAGLIADNRRPFFRDRITFPICNAMGSVIGFSARKYKEETFGGKYINSQETPIFKKSHTLFGLNYSRRRIVKEKRVILVEGQIDCLKMIEAGLNLTVASLGTAFGDSHGDELKKLGVRTTYLLFDGDEAGRNAASKIGDLLQKRGIEVFVVTLAQGSDPDSYLTQFGMEPLLGLLKGAETYLSFEISHLSQELNINSPVGKAELINTLKKQIQQWEDPIIVHESMRKVASLLKVPEEMVALKQPLRQIATRNQQEKTPQAIDPDRVLETDLLRWLVLMGDCFLPTAKAYLSEKHFFNSSCRELFHHLMEREAIDLLSLASLIDDQLLIDEILNKKINRERSESHFVQTVQKLLDREWMESREKVKMEIQSGQHSEEHILALTKEFDDLKTRRPIVQMQQGSQGL